MRQGTAARTERRRKHSDVAVAECHQLVGQAAALGCRPPDSYIQNTKPIFNAREVTG